MATLLGVAGARASSWPPSRASSRWSTFAEAATWLELRVAASHELRFNVRFSFGRALALAEMVGMLALANHVAWLLHVLVLLARSSWVPWMLTNEGMHALNGNVDACVVRL